MSQHWTPPNKGRTSTVNSLSTGEFPTMGDDSHRVTWVRPTNGISRSRSGLSKDQDPTVKDAAHRSQRTTSAAETYGPAGVVSVARSYHGPGCPCCATTSSRKVRSAFGEQDNFRAGGSTGYKAG
ncbi:hypothetical protein [Actinacidiphila sp. ITFR-21]|uniref:hypothetical protein n=1 Tax=Actinacidiphila sp. ITFR-21 TaxID=3075199 RepID=UPI00288944E2|nr:hypothetical protein [Streptomyces sp. ITFR-21]WNI17583.1 hypothetical protein RLT57_20045 [Streptomyces sp. ITFR-21]WNI17723.1 hypothetical protein RLT57_20760 [Streptomyces sp. ITFR-21]